MEWDLRHAQANDALNELRAALRLRSYLYRDKDRFQRGQRMQTRSRGVIQNCQDRVDGSALKYRVARDALVHLSRRLNNLGWEAALPVLKDTDVRGMTEAALRGEEESIGEGRRTLTWIWTTLGVGAQVGGDEGLQDGTRDCSKISITNIPIYTRNTN